MTGGEALRFPAVSAPVAEFPLELLPFPGHPQGWSGTGVEFLEAVRSGTVSLAAAPLVSLVEQYIRQRERWGLDETAESLHLAATLCDAKSRLLLPRDPALDEPDPREQLVAALDAELRRARSAAEAAELPVEPAVENRPVGLSLGDLLVLLHEVEVRASARAQAALEISEPAITVADQIRWLRAQLPAFPAGGAEAETLFAAHPKLEAKNCLFLALLELAKQGALVLAQEGAFAGIRVLAALGA